MENLTRLRNQTTSRMSNYKKEKKTETGTVNLWMLAGSFILLVVAFVLLGLPRLTDDTLLFFAPNK